MKGPYPPLLTEFLLNAQSDLNTFELISTAMAIYVAANQDIGGYDFGVIYDNGNKDFKNFAGTNFSDISQQAFYLSQAYPKMSYLSDKPFLVADTRHISHITSGNEVVTIGFSGTSSCLRLAFKTAKAAGQYAHDLRDVIKDTKEEKRVEAKFKPPAKSSTVGNVVYPAAFKLI